MCFLTDVQLSVFACAQRSFSSNLVFTENFEKNMHFFKKNHVVGYMENEEFLENLKFAENCTGSVWRLHQLKSWLIPEVVAEFFEKFQI